MLLANQEELTFRSAPVLSHDFVVALSARYPERLLITFFTVDCCWTAITLGWEGWGLQNIIILLFFF